ncbi:G-protein coupled receptor-associated protein [Trichinella spiralis]|uniref:G-protein coupled receptor-associated protein n=1 Tax=Trichinella spiralis TaxID=6334 RepID=A0ABR3KB40_TRISP
MNVALLAVQLLFVFIIVVLILHQYGDWQRQHFLVSFSTVVAWFLAFVIVFMLPLDVVLTFHRLCDNREIIVNNDTNRSFVPADDNCQSSDIDLPDNVLPILWRFVYWTSQLLTWIILPIMQSYSNAGEFTALGKLKRALINNALYYGTYLIIFAFLLLYAVSKGHYLNAGNLKTICIAASNTWGLFWLVLLLGYGLVEVPRNTWLNSKPGYTLMKLYFKLGKLMVERNDAEETVKELCQQAYLLSLQNENCSVRYPMLKVILEKFPTSMVRAVEKKAPQTIAQSDKQSSEKMLILFHKQVIKSLQDYNRTNAQYDAAMANAIYLEDVEKNQQSPDTQALIVQNQNPLIGVICHPTIRWYFDCRLKRYLLIVLSVFCCIMSVFIVWSEMTFSNVNPPLSLAALFVHMAAGDKNYMFIEMFSITTISYMCICAYYTVFRLKVYRYYHLDSHHHTDENSLLFSAILLCRLTPPLCLNFLGIIHMDMHVTKDLNLQTETAYTKLMGHLDVIEPISIHCGR